MVWRLAPFSGATAKPEGFLNNFMFMAKALEAAKTKVKRAVGRPRKVKIAEPVAPPAEPVGVSVVGTSPVQKRGVLSFAKVEVNGREFVEVKKDDGCTYLLSEKEFDAIPNV